MEAPRVVHEM